MVLTANFPQPSASLNLSSLEFMKAELVNVTAHFSITDSRSTHVLIGI